MCGVSDGLSQPRNTERGSLQSAPIMPLYISMKLERLTNNLLLILYKSNERWKIFWVGEQVCMEPRLNSWP